MNEIKENGPVQGENISLRLQVIRVNYANTNNLLRTLLSV